MSARYHNKFYRSRDGIVFGICQGFADWRELSAGMVRFIFILLMIFTGFVPMLLIYIALAIFLPVEPRDGNWRDSDRDPRPDDGSGTDYKKRREQEWDRKFYDR